MGVNTTLEILHSKVWEFRSQYSHKFATPDVRTSANFAMCEAGEALDAWIRLNTGDAYNRANIRDRKIDDELVQCAMMIMTALGVDFKYGGRPIVQPLTGERDIIEKVFHELGMLPLLSPISIENMAGRLPVFNAARKAVQR